MKVSVLASGSKGNSTYIETNNHKILIDLGTTSLYVEKKLKNLGVDPSSIDSIFITHAHTDHIAGIRVFSKKYHPRIFLTKKIYKEVNEQVFLENYEFIEESFLYDDVFVEFFKTSHDTEESVGYIFTSDRKSIVYITDTGYVHKKYFPLLQNKTMYIMESNHDVEMLMNGTYPYVIKQRILGDRGHLSNHDSAYYLSKWIGDNTDRIILAHLSEDNNTEKLALSTLEQTLKEKQIRKPNILAARQRESTELFTL